MKNAFRRAWRRGDHAAAREQRQQLRGLPSGDPRDPGFRRLRYARYADDHLLGFTGPKAETVQIKARLAEYRGIVQYYLLAGDVWRLNRPRWVTETSMLQTLGAP